MKADPERVPSTPRRGGTAVFLQNRDFFGAMVVHVPLLHALRRAEPDAPLVVYAPFERGRLFASIGLADEVRLYRSPNGALWSDLRERRFARIVSLRPQSFGLTALISTVGAGRTLGYSTALSRIVFTRTVPRDVTIYRALNYLHLLEGEVEIPSTDAAVRALAALDARDGARGEARDTGRDTARGTARDTDTTRDTARDTTRDTARGTARDTPRGTPRDTMPDAAREGVADDTRENATRRAAGSTHARPYVLMPCGSEERKLWGESNFVALARALLAAEPDASFQLVLGGGERRYVELFERAGLSARTTSLIDGRLPDIARAVIGARAVVANDCGPSHVAQLADVPSVYVFGNWDGAARARIDEWFHPKPGARCLTTNRIAPIASVSVDDVLAAVRHVRDEPRSAARILEVTPATTSASA